MLSKVISASFHGIDGYIVTVEVDISQGLPSFSTVGLPDRAVTESKDRVFSAIKNSGFEYPARRITVNLAPSDIKKEGVGFDLPIAVGILSACGIIKSENLEKYVIVGQLALDGTLRSIRGILP
ncbi:MAG: magnesium chelatase domain-containing protein, partial [Endomicrobiia bacterium]